MNRGDRREAIFQDDVDRNCLLQTLGEACAKTGWEILAYCLMANHFHIVVETPQANLVAGMQWFLSTYTSRFNRRHKLFGHLFSGRYKALLVDGSGNGYLRTVCDYVHLNPVRARLLRTDQALEDYPWSSYPQYLKTPEQRSVWLKVGRLLGELSIPQDSEAGRAQVAQYMEARRWESTDEEQSRRIRRGWCLGREAFRRELLAGVGEKRGPNHLGEEWQESQIARAERLVREGLAANGWTEADLVQHLKTDRLKVELAQKLRRESVVSLSWIAQRLHMGSVSTLKNALHNANSLV